MQSRREQCALSGSIGVHHYGQHPGNSLSCLAALLLCCVACSVAFNKRDAKGPNEPTKSNSRQRAHLSKLPEIPHMRAEHRTEHRNSIGHIAYAEYKCHVKNPTTPHPSSWKCGNEWHARNQQTRAAIALRLKWVIAFGSMRRNRVRKGAKRNWKGITRVCGWSKNAWCEKIQIV